jgi:RimJ/RimL family protein N-acetyltransferase
VDPAGFRPPLTLTGRHVDMVPLERAHASELQRALADPEVRRFLVLPRGPTLADTEETLAILIERQDAGTDLPFATRLKRSGEIVGMSRFLHIDRENESVEIGGTVVDRRYWRTPVNTDAKLAMLGYSFEAAHVHRVSLQTDLRNLRSQAAIARLGAVREGIHREDRLLFDGYRRSSVVFSILATEWPAARERLERALERPWSPAGEPVPATKRRAVGSPP